MGCHLEKITRVVVWSSNRRCDLGLLIGVVIGVGIYCTVQEGVHQGLLIRIVFFFQLGLSTELLIGVVIWVFIWACHIQ